MYLQRIELQGFKSFAHKTILEFPAPGSGCKTSPKIKARNGQVVEKGICGVTAIVGPNGSGKSNIVDAVRWVLGEQSLKLLRGKKSTDIIFSGSAKKSQMGLAEVSLHLNNEDKSAPIDYTEIVITRKLYRDGESEYLLNKNSVRLFDIIMLLAKANFGQNTYSIIGQGMVDKIVNYSSQERKDFFDEATGVKQFQIKRDRSVNKLKKSRDNLAQAQTLIGELEPHLKMLTKQVNRWRKRKEIETELKDCWEKYYGRQWFELDNSYKEFIISVTSYDKQKIKLEQEIESLQEKLDSLSVASSRSEEFDKLQKDYNNLTENKNNILKELTVVNGKLDVEYAKVGKQNLSWLFTRKDELKKRLLEINSELESLKLKINSKKKDLAGLESDINKINNELTVSQNNLQIIQEELYKTKGGERNNYFLESIKSILRQKNSIGGIYGTVADVGKIDKKYEMALATAAGNRLWAIVVETDEVAVKCINYLKANRLSSLTFFPLNKLKNYPSDKYTGQNSGAIGMAIDLISYGVRFAKVFQHILGDTLVVKGVEDAKAIGIGHRRMVTLEGDIFEKTGVIKGGYKRQGSAVWAGVGESKFSTQEERIKEFATLKAEIEEKHRLRDGIIAKMNDFKVEIRLSEDKINSLHIELSAFKKENDKIENDIKEGQLTPQERNKFSDELSLQKNKFEKELSEIDKDVLSARKKIDRFNLEEEDKKKEVFSLQQNMHLRQIDLNKIISLLNEAKIELAKIETKKEDLLSLIRQDLGEEYRPKSRADFSDVDLADLENKISKAKKQLELIGGTDPEVEKEYLEVQTRFDFLSSESMDLEKAIGDLEKIVIELDKIIKKQFESEFKKINQDFSRFFKKLFDGGLAKLVLVQKELTEAEQVKAEIENIEISGNTEEIAKPKKQAVHIEDKSFLANMGIDIEACPPGKKIKNINVLSGGEKTMTALALICSIISNNPSPFILFDEVDAALDEENSRKFSDIIDELSHKTQFITITHNRAIMSRADVLYGVTMQGDGVSRILSLKFEQAEKIAEK
ncbi:MAG: AAA family ATPase [Candidatus Buchananbacteria bacterium]|nr:AAA family ATPase [Candidatus Buchananbacteria bacterium]